MRGTTGPKTCNPCASPITFSCFRRLCDLQGTPTFALCGWHGRTRFKGLTRFLEASNSSHHLDRGIVSGEPVLAEERSPTQNLADLLVNKTLAGKMPSVDELQEAWT